MTGLVGLVIVSHSARLAEGVVELAGQMAPGVPLLAVGGMSDGGLGTDFDAVSAAVSSADQGAGVVVLFDLGSARMTADMAVELVADPGRAVVADAPLVEGTVAAAVASAGGGDVTAVVAAAEGWPVVSSDSESTVQAAVVLTNEIGLHARPAAMLARSVAELDASVTVALGEQRADAASVLALLGLAARKGDRLVVTARGNQAAEALARIQRLADENFGE